MPIAFAVLGNLLYHSSQKLTSSQVNPFLTLSASFALASLIALCAFFFTKTAPLSVEWSKVSWTAAGVGVAVIVIETSFLLAYRSGWPVGFTSLIVTIAQTALLIPLGMLFFGERLTAGSVAGAVIGLAGLALILARTTR